VQVAAEHQRLLRTQGVKDSAGLSAPFMGTIVKTEVNGSIHVRRDFHNAFIGLQRNTAVVAKMLELLKQRATVA
jgi:hypothetical protein